MKSIKRVAVSTLLVLSLSTNPKPANAGQFDNSIVIQLAIAAVALLRNTCHYQLEMEILRERAAQNAGPTIESKVYIQWTPMWDPKPQQDWLTLQIRAAQNAMIYAGHLPDLEMIADWFELIQNPTQDIIDFVKGLRWSIGFPTFTSDFLPAYELPRAQRERADKGRPAIFASERLALAKKLLRANPNLTMKTKIHRSLWAVYEADKYFILANTANRSDADYISRRIGELDQAIKEEGLDQAMSFADYTLIAHSWARILSVYPSKKLGRLTPIFTITTYKKMKSQSDQQHKLSGSAGIFFPHISKTGYAPIRVINDGWAFSTGNGQVSYVDFGGVATDEYTSFDFLKDAVSITGFKHDQIHAESAGRYGSKKLDPIFLARKAASLRENAMRHLDGFKERLALFEFAFFEIFHESSRPIENLAQEIADRLDKGILDYESMIKGAQHLEIELDGNQESACLQKLIQGLNILASYARFYDERDSYL